MTAATELEGLRKMVEVPVICGSMDVMLVVVGGGLGITATEVVDEVVVVRGIDEETVVELKTEEDESDADALDTETLAEDDTCE